MEKIKIGLFNTVEDNHAYMAGNERHLAGSSPWRAHTCGPNEFTS